MNKLVVLLLFFLFFLPVTELYAQPVPAQYTWPDFPNTAGYDGQVPTFRRCINFFDQLDSLGIPHPAFADGSYDIYDEIKSIIESIGRPGVISDTLDVLYFPEGVYRINNMVTLGTSNIVIKGDGSDKTIFKWVGPQQYCFNVFGQDSLGAGGVAATGLEQDYFFQMPDDRLNFQPGDWAVLTRNDPGRGCDSTYIRQFARVDSVWENFVGFKEPLRIRYDANEDGARVHKLLPIQNIGFEDLAIDASENMGAERLGTMHSNIAFQFSVNGWVRGVESYKPAFQHVIINLASNIEVSGCYFHDGHEFIGGRGYGVNMQNGAAECRIENNIFRALRHAILMQRGANGNVVAYNFCIDSKDGNGEDDLIFHGGHAFRNLVEGNSVEHLHFDLRQCDNGPYNIVFRNRVRKKNVQAGSWPLGAGGQFCVVGNESKQCIQLVGNSHDSWDNEENGFLCCCGNGDDGDPEPIGNSLIYQDAPAYIGADNWPLFGPGSPASATLPASERYFSQGSLTVPAYTFECYAPSPLNASATIAPCQILPQEGFKMAGRINLDVTGGVPPYEIEWTGEGLQTSDHEALFFSETDWTVRVTDQIGGAVLIQGMAAPCEAADLDSWRMEETAPYTRPFKASVYPNPSQGQSSLKVQLYQAASFQADIYSTTGNHLIAIQAPSLLEAGAHAFQFPTEGWLAGIYFVRVLVGEQSTVVRLVVW